MSKKCMSLWREAHFEVKMYKAHQLRTTFRSWDVEKVHAVVARSTCRSQNVQIIPAPDHFWKLRCRKSARVCGAKHISKSKCTKHTSGPLLEVEMSKNEAHFEVKMLKTQRVRTTFWRSDVFCVAGARDCAPCQKWAKREGFVPCLETMAGVGHLKRICKDAFSVASVVQDMFIRDVRRWGRWFPERGCILEHQICRFAEMILRDRCSTSYDVASLFRGRRNTLGLEKSQNALVRGHQLCTQLSICFVLASSRIEEVLQNSCVFKLADRQTDRQTDR